ncbi:stearoyl-CoA 9-desaturase, partial [Staphylococcus epidermidis]
KWITCLFVAFPVFTSYTAYRNAHHCTGFFKTTLPGFYSVVKDIFTPNYERKES